MNLFGSVRIESLAHSEWTDCKTVGAAREQKSSVSFSRTFRKNLACIAGKFSVS